ncbi:ATP-binding cassette domain-containing protein [Tumidithrix elongata RA019]|uniref:ABC-type quaternary amine transporter n=1 Tax=Tumidithrix elongata BACA0141 TaxID=2716417 RepID=A0AAW9Q2M2_9CYAN|nr:ATP-binding cassette domain-containing protein [Tumidithrix elongata RA019]
MPKAIEFRNASYQLDRRDLVSELSFEVEQGEIVTLLGKSGCGKTTTLKLINRLLLPSQGEVLVDGISTNKWNPIQLRRQTGYAIQETGLFPHFTVEANIGLVPKLLGWQSQQIANRVRQLLELVGLNAEQFANRYPHELSGGQRQRVGVARALAADPPVLLMDEPFGALDLITRLEIQGEFKQLQKQLEKTVIFVTHDIQEAFLLGDRIGFMDAGKLLAIATKADLMRSEVPEVQVFMESVRTLRDLLNTDS